MTCSDTKDPKEKKETVEGEDEEEPQDDCGDQDVSHMELAWEMLELTCSICMRYGKTLSFFTPLPLVHEYF